jgi:hypothetical protein
MKHINHYLTKTWEGLKYALTSPEGIIWTALITLLIALTITQ